MTFQEACIALINYEGPVRRASWEEEDWTLHVGSGLADLTEEDILATDWELVDP